MFIEACILAAGLRAGEVLFKKLRDKIKKTEEHNVSVEVPNHQMVEKTLSEDDNAGKYEKEVNQCLSLSVVSMGLAAIGGASLPVFSLLSAGVTLYTCIPVFRVIVDAIFKEHTIKRIAFVDAFAVIAMILSGYYLCAPLTMTAYFGAQKLRILTEKKSRKSLVSIFGEQVTSVWILKHGVQVEIPFEDLQAGDIVVVNAGEHIPADGIVVQGAASVDQHMLTGEFQPVEKDAGERVFAATVVISGRIHVRVEKAGLETAAAKICEVLKKTADFTAKIESIGQEIADESVIPTLGCSVLALSVVGWEGMVGAIFSNFLVNMRLVAPIGMLNSLRIASQEGILIKDGRSLQLLPLVDTVVFDKTGTLTLEQPNVGKIYTFGDAEEDAVLAWSAAAEQRQKHPIAKALTEEAEKRGLSLPHTDEAEYKIGYGIRVKIGNRLIRTGSSRFMEMESVSFPEGLDEILKNTYERGCSLVYVAADERITGAIELWQTLRPEVTEVMDRLKRFNMKFYIISGDHESPTKAMAVALGIDHYFAEVLPQDKASLIEKLRKSGRKVCFVGDGINDAIALKKADVSVSMSGASTVATDSAQIVLMDKTLGKLPDIFDIACNFQDNMRDTFLGVSAPMVIGISGIFTAGFRLPALIPLYVVSVLLGGCMTMLPALKIDRDKEKEKKEKKLYLPEKI